MKYEKRIACVSYFVVCFTKTFAKYLQNVKYEKCIAAYENLGATSEIGTQKKYKLILMINSKIIL